jgi:hypothetical protein
MASWDDEEDDRGLERRSLCITGDVVTMGLFESGCDGEGCRVEKIKLPRATGGSWDLRRNGHSPFSGLSWLARYTAKVLALVVLYLRIGALPAKRRLNVKHEGVAQLTFSQPDRSWRIYLLEGLGLECYDNRLWHLKYLSTKSWNPCRRVA